MPAVLVLQCNECLYTKWIAGSTSCFSTVMTDSDEAQDIPIATNSAAEPWNPGSVSASAAGTLNHHQVRGQQATVAGQALALESKRPASSGPQAAADAGDINPIHGSISEQLHICQWLQQLPAVPLDVAVQHSSFEGVPALAEELGGSQLSDVALKDMLLHERVIARLTAAANGGAAELEQHAARQVAKHPLNQQQHQPQLNLNFSPVEMENFTSTSSSGCHHHQQQQQQGEEEAEKGDAEEHWQELKQRHWQELQHNQKQHDWSPPYACGAQPQTDMDVDGVADSTLSEQRDSMKKSNFRGLTWDRRDGRWRVRIQWKGKQHHVGRFADELQAARHFDSAAYYLFQNRAVTNFGIAAAAASKFPVPASIRMLLLQDNCDPCSTPPAAPDDITVGQSGQAAAAALEELDIPCISQSTAGHATWDSSIPAPHVLLPFAVATIGMQPPMQRQRQTQNTLDTQRSPTWQTLSSAACLPVLETAQLLKQQQQQQQALCIQGPTPQQPLISNRLTALREYFQQAEQQQHAQYEQSQQQQPDDTMLMFSSLAAARSSTDYWQQQQQQGQQHTAQQAVAAGRQAGSGDAAADLIARLIGALANRNATSTFLGKGSALNAVDNLKQQSAQRQPQQHQPSQQQLISRLTAIADKDRQQRQLQQAAAVKQQLQSQQCQAAAARTPCLIDNCAGRDQPQSVAAATAAAAAPIVMTFELENQLMLQLLQQHQYQQLLLLRDKQPSREKICRIRGQKVMLLKQLLQGLQQTLKDGEQQQLQLPRHSEAHVSQYEVQDNPAHQVPSQPQQPQEKAAHNNQHQHQQQAISSWDSKRFASFTSSHSTSIKEGIPSALLAALNHHARQSHWRVHSLSSSHGSTAPSARPAVRAGAAAPAELPPAVLAAAADGGSVTGKKRLRPDHETPSEANPQAVPAANRLLLHSSQQQGYHGAALLEDFAMLPLLLRDSVANALVQMAGLQQAPLDTAANTTSGRQAHNTVHMAEPGAAAEPAACFVPPCGRRATTGPLLNIDQQADESMPTDDLRVPQRTANPEAAEAADFTPAARSAGSLQQQHEVQPATPASFAGSALLQLYAVAAALAEEQKQHNKQTASAPH